MNLDLKKPFDYLSEELNTGTAISTNNFTSQGLTTEQSNYKTPQPRLKNPESRILNAEIEEQLKSADQRCEALEKQLEQMRSIVKQTTEQNSLEIEKI